MKQYINQVENTLKELFPNIEVKVLCCYDKYAIELHDEGNTFDTIKEKKIYQTLLYYTIEKENRFALVKSTGIYLHSKEVDKIYENYNSRNNAAGLQFEFKGLLFSEFRPRKGYDWTGDMRALQSTKDKEYIRKLQYACGFKKTIQPITKQSALQFLKKHTGGFSEIYKMLADLSKQQPLSGRFKYEDEQLKLYVTTDNGKYSFPLQHISDTCTDDEIIRLFVDLFEPELLKDNPLIKLEQIAA